MGSATYNLSEVYPAPTGSQETRVKSVVYIVDDDVSVRESLDQLIRCAGWEPVVFASGREFLSHSQVSAPSCIILDVGLPDINGLDLQQQLAEGYHPPIIFLTGTGDIPTSVRAIRAGALDFLTKPFRPEHLRALVCTALAHDCERRANQESINSLKVRHQSLTPREREVLPLVVSGLLNKQAAAHLGISEITLQIHRTNVMRKMKSRSLAELVRMADVMDIPLTNIQQQPQRAVTFGLAATSFGLA
jgi:FixJ family two-component response regulator